MSIELRDSEVVGTVDPWPRYRVVISSTSTDQARHAAHRVAGAVPDLMGHESALAFIESVARWSRGNRRWVISATDSNDIARQLREFAAGSDASVVRTVRSRPNRLVFVFSGMGPQWNGMGRRLFEVSTTFRTKLLALDRVIEDVRGASIWEDLDRCQDGSIPTELAQVGNFLVQATLFDTLGEIGFRPDIVVGHSAGEVAAAYAAGVYDAEQAALVAVTRGRLQGRLSGRGAMAATSRAAIEELGHLPANIDIAAINSPDAMTLAGSEEDIATLGTEMLGRQMYFKKLRVDVPYHSAVMEEILDELSAQLSVLQPRKPTCSLVSTVTAELSDGTEWSSDYWRQNVRNTVQFRRAIETVADLGGDTFMEIGPHPVLQASVLETTRGQPIVATESLSRWSDEAETFVNSVLLLSGEGFGRPPAGSVTTSARIAAPALRRDYCWAESETEMNYRISAPVRKGMRLSGTAVVQSPAERRVDLSTSELPWLGGHNVARMGSVVPAALWIDLLAEAVTISEDEHHDGQAIYLTDVDFSEALMLGEVPTVVELRRQGTRVACWSRSFGDLRHWMQNASADGFRCDAAPVTNRQQDRSQYSSTVSHGAAYDLLALKGLVYSEPFDCLESIRLSDTGSRATASVQLREPYIDGQRAPWVVDAGLQLLVLAARSIDDWSYLPSRVESCVLAGAISEPGLYTVDAEVTFADASTIVGTVIVSNPDDEVVVVLERVHCRRNRAYTRQVVDLLSDRTYRLEARELDDLISDEVSDQGDVSIAPSRGPAEPSWINGGTTEWPEEAEHVALCADAGSDVDVANTVAESINRLAQCAPQGATLTIVGHESQGWLVGLVRSAANAYPLQIRVVLASSDANPADREVAIALIDENELIVTDKIRTLRFEAVTDPREVKPTSVATSQQRNFQFRGVLGPPEVVVETFAPLVDGEARVATTAVPMMWKDLGKILGTDAGTGTETHGGPTPFLGAAGVVIEALPGSPFRPGDHVFAAEANALKSHFVVSPDDVASLVPSGMTDAEAIANCMTWLTATVVFGDVAKIEPGDRVFVQSGAGAVGSALCLRAAHLGASVVTSVGREDKVDFVRQLVPDAEVIVARGGDIAANLALASNARFNKIVASVGGAGREALLTRLESGGVYVDIGKVMRRDEVLTPRALDRNQQYHAVDVDQMAYSKRAWFRERMSSIVESISSPENRIPVRVVPIAQAGTAARDLAAGDTVGCTVLATDESASELPCTIGPPNLSGRGTFLVTGGYGAVGLLAAEWLVARGARKLVLAGRSGVLDSDAEARTDLLRAAGAEVDVVALDTSDGDAVCEVVERLSNTDGGIRGIIHAAGVVADGPFSAISKSQISASFGAKLAGAQSLLAAVAGQDLDFTLLVSSIAGLIGFQFQPTYAAANAGLDHLAAQYNSPSRRVVSLMLPAVATSSGMAADDRVRAFFESSGILSVGPQELFALLDYAVQQQSSCVAVAKIDWVRGARATRMLARSSVTKDLVDQALAGVDGNSLLTLSNLDDKEQVEVLTMSLDTAVRQILAEDESVESSGVPLAARGLDSLGLLELQAHLDQALDASVSLLQIFRPAMSVGELASAIQASVADQFEESEI